MWANSSVSCSGSTVTWVLSVSQTFVRIVVLVPLFALIVRLAYQRRHTSTAPSHSDVFTHHVAAMELIWLLGVAVAYCGLFAHHEALMNAGMFATSIVLYGESLFQALVCVEWHLAVVHPVTYRTLRGARGVTARNVLTAVVWLLSLGLAGAAAALPPRLSGVLLVCFLCLSVSVISSCSLSVVLVLVRPAPGTAGGDAQSKQRPAIAIASISTLLWVWLVGCVVSIILVNFQLLRCDVSRSVRTALGWLNLPSSAVAPVLYLHRARKFWCGHRK